MSAWCLQMCRRSISLLYVTSDGSGAANCAGVVPIAHDSGGPRADIVEQMMGGHGLVESTGAGNISMLYHANRF